MFTTVSINEALAETVQHAAEHDRISSVSVETEFLGAYEAISKLWCADLRRDPMELDRRVGSLLIATFLLAHKVGVTDVNRAFRSRLEELQNPHE